MSKVAFIFPGQGAQKTGMGLDIFENFDVAKETFTKIDDILNKKVSKMCFEGTDEELKQTENTQSALLAVSIAALETFKSLVKITPDFLAGHSLGEYGALYESGALDLKNVFLAIQKRSELMKEATANSSDGAMCAVLGLDENTVKNSLIDGVWVANYNEPHQIVLTGHKPQIEKMGEILKEKGAKRVIELAVSGAFHSPLMKSASEKFADFVNEIEINDAKIPVITNVDAEITQKSADFKEKMPRQISSSVYWTHTIQKMLSKGVDTFVEIGAGRVLTGLNKKICPENTKLYNIYDKISLETVAKLLS